MRERRRDRDVCPLGMNKMVINHLEKLFVTNDAATVIRELEVCSDQDEVHEHVCLSVLLLHMSTAVEYRFSTQQQRCWLWQWKCRIRK